MTDRPAYFVVRRHQGQEIPEIYWDELPRAEHRRLWDLVYILRLDEQPNAATLVNAPLEKLFATFKMMRMRGKLPPRWEPPKPKPTTPSPQQEPSP